MRIDRVGGVALALVAIFTLWESRKLPLGTLQNPGPAYMPSLLALLLFGFAILVMVFGGRSARLVSVGWSEWRHVLAILLVLAFVALSIERLGYRVTVAATLVFLLGVVERRWVVTTAVFAIGFAAGSYYLFSNVLRVPLPLGPWGL
jgi:hypothetical protein